MSGHTLLIKIEENEREHAVDLKLKKTKFLDYREGGIRGKIVGESILKLKKTEKKITGRCFWSGICHDPPGKTLIDEWK